MTWDSKFGPVVTITFQATGINDWTTNTRWGAYIPPIACSWSIPTGTVFYPVYASANFDSFPVSDGTLTFKLDIGNNTDVPGTASHVMTSTDRNGILRFNSARACAIVGDGSTSISPAFVTSTNWANDTATGVVVLLSGYLKDSTS